jgi:hypothetical protein
MAIVYTMPFDELLRIHEPELVRYLYNDPVFVGSLGVPPLMSGPVAWRLGVVPADLELPNSAFGDIDSLLVNQNAPEQCRVIEFKRVKISASTYSTGRMNGLEGLGTLVHQANLRHELGFAFVWATVLVVADTRPITGGSGFAAPPIDLIDEVKARFPLGDLHPDIGVVIGEIAQVSDRPANERGMSGGEMVRKANFQQQPGLLTDAIHELFLRPSPVHTG